MGRNYLDLCNECINLMSYLPANNMDDLNTPEGRLIKQKINSVLREICCAEHTTWKFREKIKDFYLIPEQNKYSLPNGRIISIRANDGSNLPPLVYNDKSKYLPKSADGTPIYYWIYKDKICLFPTPSDSHDGNRYTIKYLTDDFATDKNGNEKCILEDADDEPIIPEMYRDLLVYGVVRDFRASLNDNKSIFYKKKYQNLYSKMLANQRLTDDYPTGNHMSWNYPSPLQTKIAIFRNPYIGNFGRDL